jgi:hypothetical protein
MEVIQYPEFKDFDKLYAMLKQIRLFKQKADNRPGFPKMESCVWGISSQKYKKLTGLSAYSLKYPEIHEEIFRIGLICPFEFKSVYLLKNVQCPKHRDKKNTSQSILISFGEYKGGLLVIEGIEYNAYHQPIQFNGKLLQHWNTEILPKEGIMCKYSLVFFN